MTLIKNAEISKKSVTLFLGLLLFILAVSSFSCEKESRCYNNEEFSLSQNSRDNDVTCGGGNPGGDGGPQLYLPFF